jgi:hypothetical protein
MLVIVVVKNSYSMSDKGQVRRFLPNKSRNNYRLFVFATLLLEYNCDYAGLCCEEKISMY